VQFSAGIDRRPEAQIGQFVRNTIFALITAHLQWFIVGEVTDAGGELNTADQEYDRMHGEDGSYFKRITLHLKPLHPSISIP